MKLLHFADLHLGVENYGRTDPATGLSSRLGDFLRTFDEVVDDGIRERVDAVLFAGDAYKTRDPNPTVQRAFAQRILRLSRAGVPTVLLVGNHDLPNVVTRATSVDIYEALAVERVRVCRRIERFTVETAAGPLQVVGLPWVTRSALLAREDYQAASMDEIARRLRESIVGARDPLALPPGRGAPVRHPAADRRRLRPAGGRGRGDRRARRHRGRDRARLHHDEPGGGRAAAAGRRAPPARRGGRRVRRPDHAG